MNTILKTGMYAVFATICALTLTEIAQGDEIKDNSSESSTSLEASSSTPFGGPEPLSLSGDIEATFTRDDVSGGWSVHAAGSYSTAGGNAIATDTFIYGVDDQDRIIGTISLPHDPAIDPVPSPFQIDASIPTPDPAWSRLEFGIHVVNEIGGTIDMRSKPFPIIWQHPILIDHAFSGSIVAAPNYLPGGIPPGVGIPHSLINGIPEGDYFAVVFFEGLPGCPSDNYEINSFRPGTDWGYDVRGPAMQYSKAWSSHGGGCIQEYHVDTKKEGSWLWGALSNTGTSSAIADVNGIPAFAICATLAACDPITPVADVTSPPTDPPPSASTTPQHDGVSSVLFLPGIKGSRLYENNPLCLIPSDGCDISLWLPLADATVPQLFMDASGTSKRSLYVHDGDIIDSVYGEHFYDAFAQEMGEAEAKGTYGNGWRWRAIAYDWRMSLPDIVNNGAKDGNRIYYGEYADTPYIEQSLRDLASSSPTGKVTIVAHSNGGLVAKALMQKLGDAGASRLVDSLILVAVPQSGAARALGALLYGDGEGLPGIGQLPNSIMSIAHAREFALNAPMAYHLLPSAKYMSAKNLSYPLVKFEEGALLANTRSVYGETIDTADELHRYVLAQEGGRVMPGSQDLHSPNILNAHLLEYAQQEHDALDVWVPPEGIEVYQLGGYGIETLSGIDTYQVPTKTGGARLSYRPLFTQDGDGTVSAPSSLMMNASAHVHAIWVDLKGLGTRGEQYSHGNIFEAPEVENTIEKILRKDTSLPDYVYAAPQSIVPQKRLGFFIHSPVSLSVSSARGDETGVESDGTMREDISGSSAGTLGDVKYVIVPAEGTYSVLLRGEADGVFTLDMQDLNGDLVTASSTIAEVQTTASTIATITVHDSVQNASQLTVDEDGDGTNDLSITPITGEVIFPPDVITPPSSTTSIAMHTAAHARKTPSLLRSVTAPLSYIAKVVLPERAAGHEKIQAKRSGRSALKKKEKTPTPTSEASSTSQAHSPEIASRHPTLIERIITFITRLLRLLLR